MTGLISCTLECNLKCKYCFEKNGDKDKCPDTSGINYKFQEAIPYFDKFIDNVYSCNNESKSVIIWHGGEPTLIKPDLMERVMEIQHDKGHNISWRIQTNGTMLTDERIALFKKYNVSVGISIDGLKHHHDKYRITKNGNPTFDLIKKNIDKLKQNNVQFSVLVTITDNNVNELNDIYRFLSAENISFSYNALYPTNNKEKCAELNVEEYSLAICDLFDLWINDQHSKIVIAPFEHIIEGLLCQERGIPACNWQKNCSESFIAIDPSGDLYPCEHWVGDIKMRLGNIQDDFGSIAKVNNIFNDRAIILEKKECEDCEILELCYGGCPWNSYILNGSINTKDYSICHGRKRLIKHIYQFLKDNYKGKIKEITV